MMTEEQVQQMLEAARTTVGGKVRIDQDMTVQERKQRLLERAVAAETRADERLQAILQALRDDDNRTLRDFEEKLFW
jgi:hypothetical protein